MTSFDSTQRNLYEKHMQRLVIQWGVGTAQYLTSLMQKNKFYSFLIFLKLYVYIVEADYSSQSTGVYPKVSGLSHNEIYLYNNKH